MTTSPQPSAGSSASRVGPHRKRTLLGAIGLTTLGAVLPGVGFILVGRRLLGLLVLLPTLVLVGLAGWFLRTDPRGVIAIAVDPERLLVTSSVLLVLLLVWVGVIVATYLVARPLDSPPGQSFLGGVFVALLCCLVAAPLAIGARYSMVQRDVVTKVFAKAEDGVSATRPTILPDADPWGGSPRVNVLLLGGDGSVDREGVRTDSVIVASMDVDTGDTVLFSLPRNLEEVPFPKDSPLHDLYPLGFDGPGSELEWMLNAVYGKVPELHPKVLGESDNEGADALKQAVSGALGIDVDYYVLINLAGFQKVVEAMGGVTVNINQPIPIGGNTDLNIPPEDYLEPGPNQHLDGFEALWFARGRYGLDDYDRMERQRCMVDAIVEAADPFTLLRRYEGLAHTGADNVLTDIPQELLRDFLDLALEVKDAKLRSVVFQSSARFNPGDPDYDWLHATVQRALVNDPGGGGKSGGKNGGSEPTPAERPADACAYAPVD